MTVKSRLLISHLIMFIVPIFMAVIVAAVMLAGALILSRGNNYLYLENISKCTRAAEISCHIFFHGNLEHPENSAGRWLISLLSPKQNLILFTKGKDPIYTYGNKDYLAQLSRIPPDSGWEERENGRTGTYIRAEDESFYYARKMTRKDTPYYFYFISNHVYRAYNPGDEAVEHLFETTMWSIGGIILLIILLTSRFLSSFMIRHIVPPLETLKQGAMEVQEGNLSIRLVHKGNDEYRPVFRAFNLMTEELSLSLTEREEEERKRKELIASISHDIRTPLTVIRAYAEGLRDGVADTEEKKEKYLSVICRRADDLDRMINQLFDLSRLDIGAKAYTEETLDLSAVLHDFIEENRNSFKEKGLILSAETAKHVPIRGSRLLLNRILMNLASNSAKYKTAGEGHLLLHLEKGNNEAVLTVTDDGPGVPETSLRHLFEAFYRTDKARSRTEDGSGLGMTIVQKAAHLMNGTVTAENVIPHGLCVEIKIPLAGESKT